MGRDKRGMKESNCARDIGMKNKKLRRAGEAALKTPQGKPWVETLWLRPTIPAVLAWPFSNGAPLGRWARL